LLLLLSPAVGSLSAGAEEGPRYDDAGKLRIPEGYRSWILVGTSLGLSYDDPEGGEMFHETLMEPGAYEHFGRTGEFREGTMLALILHEVAESRLPQRGGRFAGAVAAVEMAVQDSARHPEGWAYYDFGAAPREVAPAFPKRTCYACHAEHAAHDNVFLQFYPSLAEAAPDGTEFRSTLSASDAE
jgi:hypothetical protein